MQQKSIFQQSQFKTIERPHFESIVSRVKAMSKNPKMYEQQKNSFYSGRCEGWHPKWSFSAEPLVLWVGKYQGTFSSRNGEVVTAGLCMQTHQETCVSGTFLHNPRNVEMWGMQNDFQKFSNKHFEDFETNLLPGQQVRRKKFRALVFQLKVDSKVKALGFRSYFCSGGEWGSDQL